MKAIYGKKVGMTRVFVSDGRSVPVTVLEVPPNVVFQAKTEEKDGYAAVQVGIGSQKPQRVSKSLQNHFGQAKKGFPKITKEIRLDRHFKDTEFAVGDEITKEICFLGVGGQLVGGPGEQFAGQGQRLAGVRMSRRSQHLVDAVEGVRRLEGAQAIAALQLAPGQLGLRLRRTCLSLGQEDAAV